MRYKNGIVVALIQVTLFNLRQYLCSDLCHKIILILVTIGTLSLYLGECDMKLRLYFKTQADVKPEPVFN